MYIIANFIIHINKEIDKIVSINRKILDYYDSPNFHKVKETCDVLMSSQREFNEYISEKVQSISRLFGTRVVRNKTQGRHGLHGWLPLHFLTDL